MPKHPGKPEQLIPQLQDWDTADLQSLQAMIQGLIEARSEAQSPTKLDGSPIGQRGGSGCIELKMIPDRKSGKTFGPYRYLRYWGVSQKTGKKGLLSVYLGKVATTND